MSDEEINAMGEDTNHWADGLTDEEIALVIKNAEDRERSEGDAQYDEESDNELAFN